jgi:hypothetical protein
MVILSALVLTGCPVAHGEDRPFLAGSNDEDDGPCGGLETGYGVCAGGRSRAFRPCMNDNEGPGRPDRRGVHRVRSACHRQEAEA